MSEVRMRCEWEIQRRNKQASSGKTLGDELNELRPKTLRYT